MENSRNIKKRIMAKLTEDPESRNCDDHRLFWDVCEPSFERIARIRKKLQMKYPELRPEKSKGFTPNHNAIYYCVRADVKKHRYNSDVDVYHMEGGNCYNTKEEAEFALEKQILLMELQNFADMNNNVVYSDASDIPEHKYFIRYNSWDEKLELSPIGFFVDVWQACFTPKSIGEQAITQFGDRIKKYIFGAR